VTLDFVFLACNLIKQQPNRDPALSLVNPTGSLFIFVTTVKPQLSKKLHRKKSAKTGQ
jgi:hypothetical protein